MWRWAANRPPEWQRESRVTARRRTSLTSAVSASSVSKSQVCARNSPSLEYCKNAYMYWTVSKFRKPKDTHMSPSSGNPVLPMCSWLSPSSGNPVHVIHMCSKPSPSSVNPLICICLESRLYKPKIKHIPVLTFRFRVNHVHTQLNPRRLKKGLKSTRVLIIEQ